MTRPTHRPMLRRSAFSCFPALALTLIVGCSTTPGPDAPPPAPGKSPLPTDRDERRILAADVELIAELEARLVDLDEKIAALEREAAEEPDPHARQQLDDHLELLHTRRTAAARALGELVKARDTETDSTADALVDLRRAAIDALDALQRTWEASPVQNKGEDLTRNAGALAEDLTAEAAEAEEHLEDAYTEAATGAEETMEDVLTTGAESPTGDPTSEEDERPAADDERAGGAR